jgi:hypothetical protein
MKNEKGEALVVIAIIILVLAIVGLIWNSNRIDSMSPEEVKLVYCMATGPDVRTRKILFGVACQINIGNDTWVDFDPGEDPTKFKDK